MFWKKTVGILRVLLAWIVISLLMYFLFKLLNPKVVPAIINFFAAKKKVFASLLFYVFFVCSILLILIVYWVGWDNIKFKYLKRKYKSKIVCTDYYKEFKQVSLANMISDQLTRVKSKKLSGHEGEEEVKKLFELEEAFKANRKLETQLSYKNGKLDGAFYTHFPSGKLQTEIHYKDGKLDGPYMTYYKNGNVHNEKNYQDGKLSGIARAYDEDGSIFFEMEYKDDKQHGFDKIYHTGGIIQYEDTYEDGKKIRRKTYDTLGVLKFEHEYN